MTIMRADGRRVLAGLAVLGMVAGLSACSGEGPGSRPEASPATPAGGATLAGARLRSNAEIQVDGEIWRTVDVANAVPASFVRPPRVRPLPAAKHRRLSVHQITANGDVVAGEFDPRVPEDDSEGLIAAESRVGILRGETFDVVATTGRAKKGPWKGRHRQVPALTGSGRWLAWYETASTEVAVVDWTVRVADLEAPGRPAREIATSRDVQGHNDAPDLAGDPRPFVIGDWVYWAATVPRVAQPDPEEAQDWTPAVLRARLSARSAVETVVKDAGLPVAAGDSLVHTTYSGGGASGAGADGYEIHRRAPGPEGKDEILAKGRLAGDSAVGEVAASGRFVAWSVSSPDADDWLDEDGEEQREPAPGHLFVLELATGRITRVITADTYAGGEIGFTRRGVVWGGSDDPGEYVLDVATGQIQRVGENEGFSVVHASPESDTLLWAEEDKSDDGGQLWKEGTLR